MVAYSKEISHGSHSRVEPQKPVRGPNFAYWYFNRAAAHMGAEPIAVTPTTSSFSVAYGRCRTGRKARHGAPCKHSRYRRLPYRGGVTIRPARGCVDFGAMCLALHGLDADRLRQRRLHTSPRYIDDERAAIA